MKSQRRSRDIAVPSLTSALDGGWCSAPRPGRFYPRERDPVSIVQDAEWTSGPVWAGVENMPPPPQRISFSDHSAPNESLYLAGGYVSLVCVLYGKL